jgi:tetratricopeptide (TPR) repeat protein
MLGHYKQSIHYRELALTIAREQGNREREGMMLNNIGEIYRAMDDHAKALRCYQEALPIFGEIGERQLESLVLSNIGGVRGELGEWAEAEIELWQVIEQIGDEGRWFLPQTYADLAFVCLRQNKIEAALTAARQALSLAQTSENAECLGFAWRTLGQVLAKSNDTKRKDTQEVQSPECFAESLKVYQESGMVAERAKTLKVWAEYELQHGDQARGETMWQEARDLFERLGLSSLLLDQTD